MNIEYDPAHEAAAAMKLAAEAVGVERQRWIMLALAWQQIARRPRSPLDVKAEKAA